MHAAHHTCYWDIFHLRDDHLGPSSHPLPIEAIKVQRVRKCKGLETWRGEYRITQLQLENCYFDNLFIGNVIETGGLSDSQVVVFTGHKQTDEYGIF